MDLHNITMNNKIMHTLSFRTNLVVSLRLHHKHIRHDVGLYTACMIITRVGIINSNIFLFLTVRVYPRQSNNVISISSQKKKNNNNSR